MNREDILGKSRSEYKNRDEREQQVKDKSMLTVFLTMAALSGIFAVIRGISGYPILDLGVIVCGSIASGLFERFAKTKNKQYLMIAIICCIGALAALFGFLQGK